MTNCFSFSVFLLFTLVFLFVYCSLFNSLLLPYVTVNIFFSCGPQFQLWLAGWANFDSGYTDAEYFSARFRPLEVLRFPTALLRSCGAQNTSPWRWITQDDSDGNTLLLEVPWANGIEKMSRAGPSFCKRWEDHGTSDPRVPCPRCTIRLHTNFVVVINRLSTRNNLDKPPTSVSYCLLFVLYWVKWQNEKVTACIISVLMTKLILQ